MDTESEKLLAAIISTQRTASLGTLRQGGPFVSLVPYATAADFASFYIHISRLALHTQDILKDPRVGLMIAEADSGEKDPQTLARVSILGQAVEIHPTEAEYPAAREAYLSKYPQAGPNFMLGDFSIYRITVASARYVANFGKIFNLKPADFRRAAQTSYAA